MKHLRFRLQVLIMAMLLPLAVAAQTNIRYVKPAKADGTGGDNAKDGTSWATAKKDIQDAINDLVNNNLTGEVWVAEGKYYPTETTESSGSQYYKAFKIPAGITVRGGFRNDLTASDDKKNDATTRPKTDDKLFGKTTSSGNLDGEAYTGGVYTHKTILCGDITPSKPAKLEWNSTKQQFDATFYGNSYHVVWFAMNGFTGNRANALAKPAKLEGCVIEGGHAYSSSTTEAHPHEGYGGGIYMVANSFVYNCEVRNCDASRNGGGIYMDGGGIVRRTLVHNCQALGLGTDFGYGGGICEEGTATNSKKNPIVVAQSVVTNCAGRMGGGMALIADNAEGNNKYAIVANSTLVNNNTATIEAGGVYTQKGGGLASMTIVRNKCVGSGITQNGLITGRSGGVYSRDAAYIGNTVIWGNECTANRNIQYADSRSSLSNTDKAKFFYNALSNADIADWSKSEKMGVLSLDDANTTTVENKSNKGYPLFEKPTTTAGYVQDYFKAGNDYDWKVFSESALHHAGINTSDLDYEGLTPAPQGESYDMQFGTFNSRCTMGAIVSEEPLIAPNKETAGEVHFFVDPAYNFAMHHDGTAKGTSWTTPTRFLGNVLEYIKNNSASADLKDKKIFIHVKEGIVDNTDSYKSGRVRTTTIDIPSNVTIIGSYDSHLTGTDLSLRNVVHTPTIISAQLMNDYKWNIAHLINIDNQHDILIEGFKISYANASSTELGNTNKDGAAITVVNSKDIKFRNIIVSNCTADHGSAVYADKSQVEFENCVFHNNESKVVTSSGIVYGTNGSELDFNHCDVLRNVGHASYLGSSTTNNWQNSIFYGNLQSAVTDTNIDAENSDPAIPGLNKLALPAFSGNTEKATGAYCMFDAKSEQFSAQFGGNDTGNEWQYNLQYAFVDGTGQGYPRFINPTKNAGVTPDGDATYYGRGTSFEPHNNNPIVNMASHADIHTSWGTDLVYVTRDFGGLPDIGAVENHEAVQLEEGENAYTDGQKAYGDAYYVRDYSNNGSGLLAYATDKGNKEGASPVANGIYNAAGELLDGSSWEYAVNGNGIYATKEAEHVKENSVFFAKSEEDPGKYTGKFRIKDKNGAYIYIDGTSLKTTTDKSKAAIVTVSGASTTTVSAGSRSITTTIGGQTYYFYRNGTSATIQTNPATVTLTTVSGGFSITANTRYYLVNSGSVTTPKNNSNYTAWTFEPENALKYTEVPVKQDGITELSTKTADVTANASVSEPLNFHVYKSIEDYNNSPSKKTYKIKRYSSSNYLKNSTGTNAAYLYPNATGDNFILIQDGEYGKYYIYDVTTNKYVYYYTGTSNTSRVRMDASTKSSWWIDKSATTGALNIVYGEQAWTTTGSYAITCTTSTDTRANLATKTNADAQFVLVANQAYEVYNYDVTTKEAENLNGLQYAVNLANEKFAVDGKTRTVSVAKGIYTNNSAADSKSVSQPYAYMIKEGVNVYGGFPIDGNPGMNERNPKNFETILQPQTQSPYVKYSRPTVGGGSYHVTVSDWGSCATNNNGSEKTSVGRVLVQPDNFSVKTSWDGFTMRYGYLMTAHMDNIGAKLTSTTAGEGLNPGEVIKAGGAGVLLQENGTLTNCVVKENLILCSPRNNQMIVSGKTTELDGNKLYTYHMAGAGIMMTGTLDSKGLCNGKGAVVENCVVTDNQIVTKSQNTKPDNIWEYGAGIFQNGGQVYNTIINDNDLFTVQGGAGRYSKEDQGTSYTNEMLLGGVFIASGNFYNNTVVNNIATSLYSAHNNHCTFSGIHVFDAANIYNSIISDNLSRWYYSGGTSPGNGVPVSAFKDNESSRTSRSADKVHVYYSFVNVNVGAKNSDNSLIDLVSQNDTQKTNIYLNRAQGGATTTYTTDQIYNKTATGEGRYHLTATSPAFNAGTTTIAGVDIPDYDAEYTERIKDCRIDMGAYEYNGAADVAPYTAGVSDQAVFYVTPEGYGHMTASDPANAACAAKLQTVLDAAGRYKFNNPGKQVIVKVANSWDMLHPNNEGDDGYTEPDNFTYYATRTTDYTDQDVRIWSIIIPRGVEVWGGYTDKNANGHAWTNSENGFQTRSITGNPTYFDSHYVNKLEKTEANTYHVVTFTDHVFDTNGIAYLKDEASKVATGADSNYKDLGGSDENNFLHMTTKVSGNVITDNSGNAKLINGSYASNRAVLDGIFVSGGQADATSGNSATLNVNSYGGAALVNEHAYVRNCILTGNSATNGGALALTDHALVSGCLIMDNEAHNQGGGIYVFEEGAKLSNGTTIRSLQTAGDPKMDTNMAHVMTSTIVANSAYQGGGVWYTSDINANVRFNSVAIWQNEATDQGDVHGNINPEQPTTDETESEEFYPFAYSLIQNVRASGSNNLSVLAENHTGVRFVNKNSDFGQLKPDWFDIAEEKNSSILSEKYDNFGYYGLTSYSMLCNAGMPVVNYNLLKKYIAIADNDILDQSRTESHNSFIEIGARALAKELPNKRLMLRLFVANEDVDTRTACRFMRLASESNSEGSANEYYSQEGSSFAYPFNFLQDALDYVKSARNGEISGLKLYDGNTATSEIVRNLPFEIVIGKGTYYPNKNLNGETTSVWAHTFAIPEGVTIIGGFYPVGGGETYYGRYYKKGTISDGNGDIYTYVDPIPTGPETKPAGDSGRGYKYGTETVTLPNLDEETPARTITFQQWHIQDIADRRVMADNNKNGIIEPWEFTNQTIISGNAVNGETDGVYHIMTAVADADAVGLMPKVQKTNDDFKSGTNETGYQWKEQGQQIRLNGLIVTGGNALTYLSTALDDYGSYMYYHGAGLVVDGNRYKTTLDGTNKPEFHNSAAYGLGYRDIPVSITNCQFRNNVAGYGGAISSNGSLTIYASSFEQNKAIGQTEKPEDGKEWYTNITGTKTKVEEVSYPGQGGAIHCTNQLSAFNTLFANNEACLGENETPTIALVKHPTFRVPVKDNASATLRAVGGAIMMGSAAQHHIVNCDFVRNKANAYPVVFTMNPTTEQKPNASDEVDTHDYSQIINTVAWGNEVNVINADENYKRASKLMVNIGKKTRSRDYITDKTKKDFYDPSFTSENVPSQADLDVANPELSTATWQEAAWFCAYEDGVGFKPNNTLDLRDDIIYSPKKYAPTMIETAAKKVGGSSATYQNCNILINADNDHVEGPNFGNPSIKAGYEGFMEGADWSPARFNRLTDNGNGWIRQDVKEVVIDAEKNKKDYEVTFHNDEGMTYTEDEETKYNYQGAYPVTHYISELTSDKQFPEYALWLSLGNEPYMRATNDMELKDQIINGINVGKRHKNLSRISSDPTVGVERAYIDIGMYEYQKQALLKPGSEVDILWVSTKEHPENGPADGTTWRTPTSDLQRAIETLLSSRNGNKKEIRIMEGEYAPIQPKTVNGTKYHAFVIDTKSLNERTITPSTFNDGSNNDKYYAQSLTIKGGYSAELMYEYDPVQYKTVIRQNNPGDGSQTDRLIYIADPVLRYAGKDTKVINDGAVFQQTGEHESNTAKTMPIEIDGVTLINNLAKADTKGSAIFYNDLTGVTTSHSVSVGGTITYYKDEEKDKKADNVSATETDYLTVTGGETITDPAKIVISKTQVIGSGKPEATNTGSAVYIGENGGHALIYNTVFHSNYGNPLVANNTVNVNNTFGLNLGQVQLSDATGVTVKSQMHNSALWKNYGGGIQFTIPSGAQVTYNSYTGAPDGGATNHNTALGNVNSDIANGPNFVDPENSDIEARNFDIKPSMLLLNQGSENATTGTYATQVNNHEVAGSKYVKYDYALIATTDVDVLNRPRFKNNIDLGAYEFQGNLSNILYVDPNKSHDDDATGENWDKAFGYGDLQNAIDLAAISHASAPGGTKEEAYVFMKGASATNKDLRTNETLIIRDGVSVYGSIGSSYTPWHGDDTYKTKQISEYIENMKYIREGVASNAASKTIVTGIKTSDATFSGGSDYPALIDGFVVTDPAPKASVLDITNSSAGATVVVRNVIVADNNMKDAPENTNVAVVSNGLLYEVLMRDNTTKGSGAAVLKVGANGYAVNVTVEGDTKDVNDKKPVDGRITGVSGEEKASHIYNSITNSIGTGSSVKGAYGNIYNKGISGYFYNIADPNLNYQLTETSKYIDACEESLDGLPVNLAAFINYATDRDILGNPRLLTDVTTASKIDRGAFETWKVKNTGNGFICGENGTIGNNSSYSSATYTNIKKHFYPHDGSVCYIMNDQSLVIDPWDPAHEVKPTPHNPGFMLVKEGANFYGNGRPATCAYLAVERKIPSQGAVISVPFTMAYKKNVSVVTTEAGGNLILTKDNPAAVYSYDGGKRSDWKHIFQKTFNIEDANNCWNNVDGNTSVDANNGVFYQANGDNQDGDKTFRFTGQGISMTDYIYTESSEGFKTVVLKKNDDSESTGHGADFTKEEDMGWNCVGLPYLVCEYKTYSMNGDDYMMHTPKEMWLYYNGTTSPDGSDVNGDGGYYSVKSWDITDHWHLAGKTEGGTTTYPTPAIWVGEGIFMQTATLNDTEDLKFYRPVAPTSFPTTSVAKGSKVERFYNDATGIKEINSSDDAVIVATEYYTAGGLRIDKPRKGDGVVIIRNIYSDGSYKTSKRSFK